jgi:hypothetical protein
MGKKIIIFFPLLLLLSTGCPETLGQQCPPNTFAIGQYAISFAGQHPAGECRVVVGPDGGPADASMALDDAGTRAGTLCTATDSDGGTLLYLSVPGKGQRPATIFNDGGFRFLGHTDPSPGTACGCSVAIDETFDGILTGAWDGSFPVLPDGGLPLITGLKGTVVDQLSPTPGAACLCTAPCPVTFSVVGTRF